MSLEIKLRWTKIYHKNGF